MNVIIIPAYQPNQLLIQLASQLLAIPLEPIVVINDGSSKEKETVFQELETLGCHVIHHPINQGKGAAIKSGIQYAFEHFEGLTGYITCDADGQHQAQDILKVSLALSENQSSLVMGSRDFSGKNVPKKSRFGNRFSSFYFKATTGATCLDTQTGLRGIPVSLTELALGIKENRYDYEMNFLMEAARSSTKIVSVPISTVYLDQNASSHFRPFVDSIRIYKEPIKFALSSLFCAGVDLGVFTLLATIMNDGIVKKVMIATIAARIVSGVINFSLNRLWSFRSRNALFRQFRRYALLYVIQLVLSIAFVSLLSFIPIHLTIIKIFVDSLLFIGSFFVQRNWVFKKHLIDQ